MLYPRVTHLKKSILATAIVFALSGCDSSSSSNDVALGDDLTEISFEDTDSESDIDIDDAEVNDSDVADDTSDETIDETVDNETVEPVDDAETVDNGSNNDDENTDSTDNGSDENTDGEGDNPDAPVADAPIEEILIDSDGDGLFDDDEIEIGINPNNPDTDGDGFEDGVDAFPNDATANADSDGDGVDDGRDEFPNDATETTDLNGDGLGDNANPIDGAILNGTITNASDSSVIDGATVNLDLISFDTSFDAVNRTISDLNGEYQIVVDASLVPDSFIITASSAGFRPEVILADSDDFDDDEVQTIDISMTPSSTNEVIIEEIPVVHHLGDDSFGGAANSQFQRLSEGLTYTRTFSLTDEQVSSLELTLITAAKGVQRENEISINGVLVGTFPDTNSDGSYTMLEIPLTLQPDLLVTGSNTIEILSIATGQAAGDVDDFEFVNISVTGFTQ